MNNLLTVKEVTKILKISEATLYRLIRSGELRAWKVGKLLRFKKEDLNNVMKKVRPKKAGRKKGKQSAARKGRR
jgi:putative molybdopterin biosynthesis protein